MQIRVAQPGDIPEIERLLQAVWRDDVVERALRAADGLAYVAAETDLIGFGCAHDLGFRAYLSELVVADVFPPGALFYRAHGWDEPSALLLGRKLRSPDMAPEG
jgi:hypothetical protein